MPELRAEPATLRRLAEAARRTPDSDGTGRARALAWRRLHGALSPDRVLALLDRLAALEGALAVMGDALVRVHVECVDDDVDGPLSAELFAVVDDAVVLYQREARAALVGTPKP